MRSRSKAATKRDPVPRRKRPARPGSKIAALRDRAGLKQEELAERARVGLRTVQRLENPEGLDSITVTLGALHRIAWALSCESLGEVVEDRWIKWSDGKPPEHPPPRL